MTFALLLPFVFIATRNAAVDRVIGDLSYPLYLVHGIVIGVLFSRMDRPEDSIAFLLIAVAASLAAAAVMRAVVERPVEVLLRRPLARLQPMLA